MTSGNDKAALTVGLTFDVRRNEDRAAFGMQPEPTIAGMVVELERGHGSRVELLAMVAAGQLGKAGAGDFRVGRWAVGARRSGQDSSFLAFQVLHCCNSRCVMALDCSRRERRIASIVRHVNDAIDAALGVMRLSYRAIHQ